MTTLCATRRSLLPVSVFFPVMVGVLNNFSDGGKSVTVAITDRCTGCQIGDLDFSPSAFSALADESLGRIDITWVWS
jgi:expansin (peptidoglycan-binding protein)